MGHILVIISQADEGITDFDKAIKLFAGETSRHISSAWDRPVCCWKTSPEPWRTTILTSLKKNSL